MATRLQSYLSGPGKGRSTGAPLASRINDFSAWENSPDAAVLKATALHSRLAHDALMRGQASEAESDNQLLSTATPDELANLFGEPRTEREARLQRIVQRDYNAKERGAQLIPNEAEKIIYGQKVANLKRTNLQNYLDPLQFQLQQDRFGETVNQNDRSYINQLAGRDLQNRTLAATQDYRQMQARNAEANRIQRNQIHQSDFDQRNQFHGDTVANQGLQGMISFERMLHDEAEAEQRQRNTEANANRGVYHDVAAAANAGAIPPAQLNQFASRFDPGTMAMLRGYGKLGADRAALTQIQPSWWDRTMPTWLGGAPIRPQASTPQSSLPNDSMDWPDDGGDDIGDDFGAPPIQSPSPAARSAPASPSQSRGEFNSGSIIRNRRTGQLFRIMPNGQMQLVSR